ncbi:alpha/beta fold hydrolase [Methylobacterium sp. A54F]
MASEPREAGGSASGFLDLGAQHLEYRRGTPRSGRSPTIVLLHEGLGSAEGWWPFADALAEASGCLVFAYSRVGYGRSSPVTLPRPIDYLEREAAEVLPRVLDAAGIRDCILVGHSDGATIAALAAAFGDPRIHAAALIAPHVVVEAVTLEGVRRAVEAYETGDLRRRLASQHRDVDGAFRGWSDAWLDPRRRAWDVRTALRPLTVPLLLLQGENDRYGSALQIEAVTRSCPHAEAHHLPELGHSPQEQDPARVIDLILSFLLKREILPQD